MKLCDWLGVSKSGYYDWLKREESKRSIDDKRLLKRITKIYWESEGRYGSPRVYKALKKQGFSVGEKRVARLMQAAGLVGRCYTVVRHSPGNKKFVVAGENLLLQMSAPTEPNQIWVGDVTYLKLNGHWRYLATVMDLYSRRIIGWSLSNNRKASLTMEAMKHAVKKRQPPKGLIFHSDRGIEYKAHEYGNLLDKYGIVQSFNRAYHCQDNAFMESFFHSLKGELIRGRTFKAEKELRSALSKYINGFYNSRRLHSALDYMSPMEYEQRAA